MTDDSKQCRNCAHGALHDKLGLCSCTQPDLTRLNSTNALFFAHDHCCKKWQLYVPEWKRKQHEQGGLVV